jgi:DNA polymerase III sliding clamp (beta) subunit (PCNA family)
MVGVSVFKGDVLSTDGYRITWCMIKDLIDERCFFPAYSAAMLPRYSLASYCIKDNWFCLKGPEVLFCSCLLDYSFPDEKVKSFFKNIRKNKGVEIPKELGALVDRALVLLENDLLLDKEMTLEVAKGKITCRVDRKDVGWFKEKMDFPDKKTSFKIEVNPMFLKEVLKHASHMALVSDSTLRLYSDSFEHLISLR